MQIKDIIFLEELVSSMNFFKHMLTESNKIFIAYA